MISPIFTLERAIPDGLAMGILSGKYSLHGGVIRGLNGQIVRHLIPNASKAFDPLGLASVPFDITNSLQLRSLSKLTQEVKQISEATMAMSGLNIAVSAVSFAAMYSSLKNLEKRVTQLETEVNWIKTFLDSGRRAAILNASNELSSLPSDINHRLHILHQARESLGHVMMHYLAHWDEAGELLEAMSYQHFFCMAALMRARCSAELGMPDKANFEMKQSYDEWVSRSRNIAQQFILRDDPERLMGGKYSEHVPVARLVYWLDFVYDTQKGYDWIDELRCRPDSMSFKSFFSKSVSEEEAQALAHLDNLSQRNSVLEGYVTQYSYLKNKQLRPSEFEQQIDVIKASAPEEELLILAPANEDTPPASNQKIQG